jgi:hypothetical protein
MQSSNAAKLKKSEETVKTIRVQAVQKQDMRKEMPVYILVEKEKRKHQAAVERMIHNAKKKDEKIETMKSELDALKDAIYSAPIDPEVKQYLLTRKQKYGKADMNVTPVLQLDLLKTKTSILPPIAMEFDNELTVKIDDDTESIRIVAPAETVPDFSSSKVRAARYKQHDPTLEISHEQVDDAESEIESEITAATNSTKISMIKSSVDKLKGPAHRLSSHGTSIISEHTLRGYENSEVQSNLPPLIKKGLPAGAGNF